MKLCKKKPLPKRKVRPVRKSLHGDDTRDYDYTVVNFDTPEALAERKAALKLAAMEELNRRFQKQYNNTVDFHDNEEIEVPEQKAAVPIAIALPALGSRAIGAAGILAAPIASALGHPLFTETIEVSPEEAAMTKANFDALSEGLFGRPYARRFTAAPAYSNEGYAISYPDATSTERPVMIETIPYNGSEVATEEYPATGISYRRPSGFGEITFPVAFGSKLGFAVGDALRRGRLWLGKKIAGTPGTQNGELKTRDGEPKTQNGELKTRDGEPKTQNEESKTQNREPKTQNEESETRDREPKTQNEESAENPWRKPGNYFNPKKKQFWWVTAPLVGGSLLDKAIEPEGKWYYRPTVLPRLTLEGFNWLFSPNSLYEPYFINTSRTPTDTVPVKPTDTTSAEQTDTTSADTFVVDSVNVNEENYNDSAATYWNNK